ncbi:MAG TPA: hypothetical protein VGL39_28140 [Jatrophihabitantaceae bacterium]|jgi:hypothetical protein
MNTHPARTTALLYDLTEHGSAAHSGGHVHWWALLALALGTAALIYAMACAVTPFARCRRCDGNGKYRKPTGRAWHPCKRCKGSGHRLRWGRHITNYLHRIRDHSTRATKQREHLSRRGPR